MKTLFLLFISVMLFPQSDSEKINWSENRKLTWEDFKGTPTTSLGFAASTNTGIHFRYSYSMENDEAIVEYSVKSFFVPEKSWYIPGKVSQQVLKHEQTHFDISELHARILLKRLESHKFSKNIKLKIAPIYLQVEEQRKLMQKQFDVQTNHSQNLKEEILWEERIAKELEDYASWK